MTEAFPLQWPAGWKRTDYWNRKHARFDATFAMARDGLLNELRMMRAGNIVLSTNVILRRDGLPYANQANPTDPGVAVYFTIWKALKTQQKVIACDRWKDVADNLRAIQKTIEALRGLDRWGASEVLDRAFTGFEQLPPPPKKESKRPWWEVLEFGGPLVNSKDIAERRRELARRYHPDNGYEPNATKMAEINAAADEADR